MGDIYADIKLQLSMYIVICMHYSHLSIKLLYVSPPT